MGNRITGLSGMDIEGMVGSLMKAETAKVDKLYKQKTLLTWKQDAYKNLSSSLSTFQNKFFSFTSSSMNLKSSAFYLMKNFKITSNGLDSKAVTVKNTSLAKNVDHKLKIYDLAQAQKMSGTPAETGTYSKKITSGNINVDNLTDDMTLELNLDGKKKKAKLTGLKDAFDEIEGDTATYDTPEKIAAAKLDKVAEILNSQFADFGKASNVQAKADDPFYGNKVYVKADAGKLVFATEAGRSLSVSSFNNDYKDSRQFTYTAGKTNDTLQFDINGITIDVDTFNMVDADDDDPDAVDGQKKVYLNAKDLAARITEIINGEGVNGPLGADNTYAKNLVVTASGKDIKFEAKSTTQKFTIKETTAIDPDADPPRTKLIGDNSFMIYGKKTSEFSVEAGASTDNTSTMNVGSALGISDTDNNALNNITIKGRSLASLGIGKNTTVSQMISTINNAKLGITMSYSTISGAFTMEGTQTGEAYGFDLSDEAVTAFGFSNLFQKETEEVDGEEVETGRYLRDANNKLMATADALSSGKYVKAQDAKFEIDGIMTTRETNNVTLGDLQITLNETTVGTDKDGTPYSNEITVKSSSDTDTMIKNIKEFIDEYNKLLSSLNSATTQIRAKNSNYSYYEPLTDEEKSAMSEKDIELWEEKAKEGILNRDGTVTRVIDQLRNAMISPVPLGNKREISLASIGISSTDWRDMGTLTIDEDKLRKALEERPEDVSKLFSNMSSEGYYGDRQKRSAESGIAYRLDDIMQDATRTTPHPKFGTYGYFVDIAGGKTAKISDNAMAKRLKEINQKIYDLEILNMTKENKYYNMFSKMEQAMTKSQNQMNMAGLA